MEIWIVYVRVFRPVRAKNSQHW